MGQQYYITSSHPCRMSKEIQCGRYSCHFPLKSLHKENSLHYGEDFRGSIELGVWCCELWVTSFLELKQIVRH